jgi:UDP-glucose 4-epimerase
MAGSIIVTGASGFIGKKIINYLEKKTGFQLIPVSRSKNNNSNVYVKNYIDTPVGNILLHLAEDPVRGRVNKIGDKYIKNSGLVVENLLSKGFGKIIYCSSATVYGDSGTQPYSENSTVESVDTYVRAKLENEKRVLDAGGIVVRLSNVIGSGMSRNNVISDILKQLPEGSTPIMVRNSQPVCDFIGVEDVIEALRVLILQGSGGIYNIGSGRGTSIKELIQIALKISKQQYRQIDSADSSKSFSYNVLDISKMKQMYGWLPAISMEQYLKRLIRNERY